MKVLPGKSIAILRFIHPPVYVGETEGNVDGEADIVGDSDGKREGNVDGETDSVGDCETEGNVDGETDIVGETDGNFVSVGAGEIVGSKGQNGTSQYSHSLSGSVV